MTARDEDELMRKITDHVDGRTVEVMMTDLPGRFLLGADVDQKTSILLGIDMAELEQALGGGVLAWLEPAGVDLRFVLAIARQEPFPEERDAILGGRACSWCDGLDRGQDMPHKRGCLWVEAAAKREDWIAEIRRQTGAGKMDAGRALDRYADVGRAVAFLEGRSLHRAGGPGVERPDPKMQPDPKMARMVEALRAHCRCDDPDRDVTPTDWTTGEPIPHHCDCPLYTFEPPVNPSPAVAVDIVRAIEQLEGRRA